MPDWWVPLKRPSRPRATLLCLPASGGSSGAFRGWVPHLPPAVALYGLDLPGRAARYGEPLLTRAEDAVDGLMRALERERLEGPLVLFGHSLGALLAFELGRALEGKGRPAAHVVLSGRGAPHLPRDPALHDLPDERFLEGLQRYDGTPAELLEDPELMALFLPILRADFALSETWRFQEGPLRAPVTVLGGTGDRTVDAAQLGAWGRHTRGPCQVIAFPGGHFFLRSCEPEVAALVGRIALERSAVSSLP